MAVRDLTEFLPIALVNKGDIRNEKELIAIGFRFFPFQCQDFELLCRMFEFKINAKKGRFDTELNINKIC